MDCFARGFVTLLTHAKHPAGNLKSERVIRLAAAPEQNYTQKKSPQTPTQKCNSPHLWSYFCLFTLRNIKSLPRLLCRFAKSVKVRSGPKITTKLDLWQNS